MENVYLGHHIKYYLIQNLFPPKSIKFPVEPNNQKDLSVTPNPASIEKNEYLEFSLVAFNLKRVV